MKTKKVVRELPEEVAEVEVCPNCGNSKFHTEFHLCEENFERFCVKCGFVVFG